jgi:23S rRNA (uracil1939-C5)-methyltransferase
MEIADFAEENDIARISWFDNSLKKPQYERLCERRKPFVRFGCRKVMTPPGSFLQATKEGEAALSRIALSFLKDCENIVDIFAGCGTFGVAALSRLNVHAVEYSEEMTNALRDSANFLKESKELTTEIRDLFLRPLNEFELSKFDGAIIDPPRAGAKAQIEEAVRSSLTKIVMISCNPATFARDARMLVDAGFEMGSVTPVDQFLYSPHLEIIACFERKKSQTLDTFDNFIEW